MSPGRPGPRAFEAAGRHLTNRNEQPPSPRAHYAILIAIVVWVLVLPLAFAFAGTGGGLGVPVFSAILVLWALMFAALVVVFVLLVRDARRARTRDDTPRVRGIELRTERRPWALHAEMTIAVRRAAVIISLVGVVVAIGVSRVDASCGAAPGGKKASSPAGPVFDGRLRAEIGEGTAGTLFAFDVDSVQRGVLPKRAVVDISVNRTVRQPDGELVEVASSVDIGPAPTIGARYRVAPYVGTPGGKRRMFINACGGSLRRLAAGGTPTSKGVSTDWYPAVLAAAAALTLAGLAVWLGRRSVVPIAPPRNGGQDH